MYDVVIINFTSKEMMLVTHSLDYESTVCHIFPSFSKCHRGDTVCTQYTAAKGQVKKLTTHLTGGKWWQGGAVG